MIDLFKGDCLELLASLPDNSVDSIVTDPPYGLAFMNKKWDYDVPSMEIWEQCLRVLKPGGYLLSFAGSRTYHRMAVRIEDAGFEIRDQLMWLYSSGFPKSHDLSKSIDKSAGATRKVIGTTKGKGGQNLNILSRPGARDSENAKGVGAYGTGAKQTTIDIPVTAPATDEAKQWEGWGSALKPAHEPIVMARKPFKGSLVKNVLTHGAGALNIDASRVGGDFGQVGRWPANVIHDGSEEVEEVFPASAGGTAARYFYCAKPGRAERDLGTTEGNKHPTVKPLALCAHLIKLVTPPGGVIVDLFMGSGSFGVAAVMNGFSFKGSETDPASFATADERINYAAKQQEEAVCQ